MSAARWYKALSDAINKENKAVSEENKYVGLEKSLKSSSSAFYLSTVDASVSPAIPYVRSVILRGFIDQSSKDTAPFLLTTTDVRTPKVDQLGSANQRVESTFWLEETKTQFRIAARAYILPHASHPLHSRFPFSLGGHDWESERMKVFNDLSGHMRASWCRPPPGSTMNKYEDAKEWPSKLPKEGEDDYDAKLTDESLTNYALVVLEPLDVDYVELAPQPNQRTRFTREGSAGEETWREEILVP